MRNHGFRYLLYDIATGIVLWHRMTALKNTYNDKRITINVEHK